MLVTDVCRRAHRRCRIIWTPHLPLSCVQEFVQRRVLPAHACHLQAALAQAGLPPLPPALLDTAATETLLSLFTAASTAQGTGAVPLEGVARSQRLELRFAHDCK